LFTYFNVDIHPRNELAECLHIVNTLLDKLPVREAGRGIEPSSPRREKPLIPRAVTSLDDGDGQARNSNVVVTSTATPAISRSYLPARNDLIATTLTGTVTPSYLGTLNDFASTTLAMPAASYLPARNDLIATTLTGTVTPSYLGTLNTLVVNEPSTLVVPGITIGTNLINPTLGTLNQAVPIIVPQYVPGIRHQNL
jgi:hypothetical protein